MCVPADDITHTKFIRSQWSILESKLIVGTCNQTSAECIWCQWSLIDQASIQNARIQMPKIFDPDIVIEGYSNTGHLQPHTNRWSFQESLWNSQRLLDRFFLSASPIQHCVLLLVSFKTTKDNYDKVLVKALPIFLCQAKNKQLKSKFTENKNKTIHLWTIESFKRKTLLTKKALIAAAATFYE